MKQMRETVRPFGDGFDVAHRPVLLQRNCHRAFVVGQRCAVGKIEFPGHTPHFAGLRRTSREVDAGAIEEGDTPMSVARVDRGGQRLKEVAKLLFMRSRILAIADSPMARAYRVDFSLVRLFYPIQRRSLPSSR